MPLSLAWATNGKERSWGKMHRKGPCLFFFWGRVVGVFGIFVAPNVFPLCSHQVPSSSSLYPISFALIYILVTNTTNPKGGNDNIYIYLELPKAWLLFFVTGQSKMAITKNLRNKLWVFPLLIPSFEEF
jgi:hypothetical protein